MKTKVIAIKGVRTLCVGVFMATMINSLTVFATGGASGNGNGDLAFSKIKQSDQSLSPFEVLVRAFEESANNPIDLEWKTSVNNKTRQVAYMLSRRGLIYNTYFPVDDDNGNQKIIENLGDGGLVVLTKNIRGTLVNNQAELPYVSILVNDNEVIWGYQNTYKTVSSIFSIKTEPDYNGSQWVIRQYNKNILLFVKLPNSENNCIVNKGSNNETKSRPLHGHCLVGYMEQVESK